MWLYKLCVVPKNIFLALTYYYESLKDYSRYPYVLDSEFVNSKNNRTVFIYRARGKRDIFEMEAQEICNNPHLITRFHPIDVRIISYICGVEQALEASEAERRTCLSLIKNKIFK